MVTPDIDTRALQVKILQAFECQKSLKYEAKGVAVLHLSSV